MAISGGTISSRGRITHSRTPAGRCGNSTVADGNGRLTQCLCRLTQRGCICTRSLTGRTNGDGVGSGCLAVRADGHGTQTFGLGFRADGYGMFDCLGFRTDGNGCQTFGIRSLADGDGCVGNAFGVLSGCRRGLADFRIAADGDGMLCQRIAVHADGSCAGF